MLKRFSLIAALAVAALRSSVEAGQVENSLRARISQSLEAVISTEVEGIQNCENKCEKAFNRLAYAISSTDNRRTYEFQACVQGCNRCGNQLQAINTTDPADCFTYCKNYDWKTNGLVKGVIEPDKACIGGCVINTCQVICTGGTTDADITPLNKQYFYPNGGCSIKTEAYSQYFEYVPWNSPNTGQGGSQDAASCCSNALSLCQYVGDTTSVNYNQLLTVTGSLCAQFVPSQTQADICTWFTDPANCGTAA